ncbi:MAG: hypothetical protein EBT15_06105 [Betaproteobacteria bacterium]|nr:hypothetical protein [Betaproteobacteria bacterium]
MRRIVVDLQTGEQRVIELTADEIAAIQSQPEPEPIPVPTPAEKLAALGLDVFDLKALLGLK